jgi:beta-glucanase (GH16 family)/lysophospholipase L1-like esterase
MPLPHPFRGVAAATALALCFGAAAAVRAANPGTDNASSPAYTAGWNNGLDGTITGPSAFGQWFLNTNIPSAYSIASAAGVGNAGAAAIDSAGVSFRLFQTNAEAAAFRFIDPAGLGVGQTFSIQLAINFRDGFKGLDLRSAAAGDPTIFNFNIGGNDYAVSGAATGNGSIGNTYSADTVFTVSFTQTNTTGGTWSIARSGGVTNSTSGTYAGVARSIKLYQNSPNDLVQNALFANNLSTAYGPGATQQVLLDFGQTATTNSASGRVWNNLTNTNSLAIGNLLDSAGAQTGYALSFSVLPQLNTNFGVIPNVSMGEFNETNVVTDAAYTDTNRPSSTFKISRLSRSNAYTFRLFGSRNATETRVTSYTLTGSNTVSGFLTNSGTGVGGPGTNYNTNVLTFSNVVPDRNGEVSVTFAVTQGSFGYLTAMSVGTTNFPDPATIYLDVANRWVDQDAAGLAPTNPVIFLGSSSIRRWESLTRDFADYNLIQRGMGGARFTDINQLTGDLVIPRNPRAIVVWAGVNDTYNSMSGTHVFQQYSNFVTTVTNALPDTSILYIGMTRNPGFESNAGVTAARTNANSLISGFIAAAGNPKLRYINLPAFFENLPLGSTNNPAPTDLWYYYVDSLHLNEAGYAVWRDSVRTALAEAGIFPDRAIPAMESSMGAGRKVLFDFGPSDTINGDATIGPDARGNFWNNWHPINGGATLVPGESIGGLVDSTGQPAGLTLTVTGEFMANGKLNGGLTNIPSLALGNLGTVTATEDYFFSSSDGLVNGGDDDDGGGLRISGLNPALTYDLRLFGSRNIATTRQTSLQVYGATTNPPIVLQTSGAGAGLNGSTGNDRSVAVFRSIRPNAYGDLFIDLTAMPQALSADVLGYLNAMELRALTPFEAWTRARGLDEADNTGLADGNPDTGTPNLRTFAFDGNPTGADGLDGRVRPAFNSTDGLQTVLPVRSGAVFGAGPSPSATQDGLNYQVLGSTNLVDWNMPVEAVPTGDTAGMPPLSATGPGGYEYRRFRLADPAGTLTKGFLKTVVQPTPGSVDGLVGARSGVEAEAFSAMQGVQIEPGGRAVGFFDGGDWIKYSGVDLGDGATGATFSVSKLGTGGTVEIRLGSPTGRLIGTFTPQPTSGWGDYREQVVQLTGFASGVQDICLVATGGAGVCNLDWFRFTRHVLAWSDEFNGAALNTNNWSPVQHGFVDNGELQFYTDRTNNVTVTNGVLQLTAVREDYTGTGPWMNGQTNTTQYTSGKVESLGKQTFQYGRIEARMRLPRGAGTWPAFWMLGANLFEPGIGWPKCGEIDIMEHPNTQDSYTAALHTQTYNHTIGTGIVGSTPITDYDTTFHVYGVEWTPDRIAFYLDGRMFFSATKAALGSSQNEWPFDQPFWLILNLAVGGSYGGVFSEWPMGTTHTVEVDWVRVYQEPAN